MGSIAKYRASQTGEREREKEREAQASSIMQRAVTETLSLPLSCLFIRVFVPLSLSRVPSTIPRIDARIPKVRTFSLVPRTRGKRSALHRPGGVHSRTRDGGTLVAALAGTCESEREGQRRCATRLVDAASSSASYAHTTSSAIQAEHCRAALTHTLSRRECICRSVVARCTYRGNARLAVEHRLGGRRRRHTSRRESLHLRPWDGAILRGGKTHLRANGKPEDTEIG